MYYRKAFARATCWSTNLPKLRFPAIGSHYVVRLAVLTWRVLSSSLGYKIKSDNQRLLHEVDIPCQEPIQNWLTE